MPTREQPRGPTVRRRDHRSVGGKAITWWWICSRHSGARVARTRNLEIPRCAIAHLRSRPSDHPGMTVVGLFSVIARSVATKQSSLCSSRMDCFAEPVIGRAFARPVGSLTMLDGAPYHPPLPRIAHQRGVAVDAVHELAVGHGDEQRKHHAEMQRQQRPHRGRVAPQ